MINRDDGSNCLFLLLEFISELNELWLCFWYGCYENGLRIFSNFFKIKINFSVGCLKCFLVYIFLSIIFGRKFYKIEFDCVG